MNYNDKLPIKHWAELVPEGHAFHLSVGLDERRMPVALHGHDFAEVCWVTEGSGWHRVNGKRLPLRTGDLFFIRPEDVHGLTAGKEGRFCLENVGLPKPALERLRRSYFSDSNEWFWSRSPLPQQILLDTEQMTRLATEVDWLRVTIRNVFALDCFFLQLFRIIGPRPEAADAGPEWLGRALRNFHGAENLRAGLPGFFRMAGRSPSHVSRVMKESSGQTPSRWINDRRVDHAARLLENTGLSVTEIAAEVGFENLSYFHRLFHQRMGTSPLRYRQRFKRLM